jgi:hypothetical protein
MKYVYLALFLILGACAKSGSTPASAVGASSCKGVYFVNDQYGYHKYNDYFSTNLNECVTEAAALTNWEKTSQKFVNGLVTCTPQPNIGFQTLTSANNFYDFRDGRMFLSLDPSTGTYKRITIGLDATGNSQFSRSMGCYYTRTGFGPDAAYGNQLLLDTDVNKFASTEIFAPFEIFDYAISGPNVTMTRFDETGDWTYEFCVTLNTPDRFCAERRNGNILYEPTLTAPTMATLTTEAIQMRAKYNWTIGSTAAFTAMWSTVGSTSTESMQGSWIYIVSPTVDTPWFIDAAWHDYVAGTAVHMPDTTSYTYGLPLCYEGSQNVTLAGGATGKVYGQICYDPATSTYTFTQGI